MNQLAWLMLNNYCNWKGPNQQSSQNEEKGIKIEKLPPWLKWTNLPMGPDVTRTQQRQTIWRTKVVSRVNNFVYFTLFLISLQFIGFKTKIIQAQTLPLHMAVNRSPETYEMKLKM